VLGVTATRVILVSDTHLSPRTPEAGANWNAVLRHVEAAAPDLVIHLGDLSLDGANDPGEMAYGREQLGRLPAAWHAVPGNHDVGDNPWPGAPAGHAIDPQRRQRWLDAVGPDRWALTAGGWTLLAVNAQLLGSGIDAEAEQWDWLERQLAERDAGGPVAMLTHKPVTASAAELAAAPPFRFWPEAARHRLAGLLGGVLPGLVISGHVHQRRLLRLDGTNHLSAPTTWAVLPDERQPVLGAKRCGIVALEFPDDGAAPRPEFAEPAGIAQHTLLRDLPDPYGR
jgi:predicted phosphodiesterase